MSGFTAVRARGFCRKLWRNPRPARSPVLGRRRPRHHSLPPPPAVADPSCSTQGRVAKHRTLSSAVACGGAPYTHNDRNVAILFGQ
ncbi:hypothetical protein J6590_070975 [Homalodisca vitripennis]|nr:hypothetical protein J6590_070975 [Homalodisca vitripennis]